MMKVSVNTWKSVKTVALLLLVMVVFVAKGYIHHPVAQSFSGKAEKSQHVEKDGNRSKKKDTGSEFSSVALEATISIFAVEFDDLSGFIVEHVPFTPLINEPVESGNTVSAIKYFRILFSRILPINAP